MHHYYYYHKMVQFSLNQINLFEVTLKWKTVWWSNIPLQRTANGSFRDTLIAFLRHIQKNTHRNNVQYKSDIQIKIQFRNMFSAMQTFPNSPCRFSFLLTYRITYPLKSEVIWNKEERKWNFVSFATFSRHKLWILIC